MTSADAPRPPADFFATYIETMHLAMRSAASDHLEACVRLVEQTCTKGRKVLVAGNGGSAAMASHVCVDFVKVAGVRAVNFNEADLITCFANDYGYENWVSRALEAYADAGDLAILISSSGQSPNMVNAAGFARSHGLQLITLTGFKPDNPLRQLGDLNLWVDSSAYNVVEMTHHVWLLAIVDCLAGRRGSTG